MHPKTRLALLAFGEILKIQRKEDELRESLLIMEGEIPAGEKPKYNLLCKEMVDEDIERRRRNGLPTGQHTHNQD